MAKKKTETAAGAKAKRPRSLGRKKIEIKKIEKEDARQVCFSKRRTGIFNKASELSIICGTEIGIVVFSPGGKPFCFGHPSVEYVVARFLAGITPSPSSVLTDQAMAASPLSAGEGSVVTDEKGDPCQEARIAELNLQCEELMRQLEDGRKRREAMETEGKGLVKGWWDRRVEELELQELEEYSRVMEDLERNLACRADLFRIAEMWPAEEEDWFVNAELPDFDENFPVIRPNGFAYGAPELPGGGSLSALIDSCFY